MGRGGLQTRQSFAGLVAIVAVVCSVLLLGAVEVQAGIFDYNDGLNSNSRILERVAMWSVKDSPIGSNEPYAKFELTLSKHNRGGHVEALFFSISELENVGYDGPAYGRYLCCDHGMHRPPAHPCPYGEVALNRDYYNHSSPTFHYSKLNFLTSTVTYSHVFPINETDLYYFILVNCMGSGANTVTVLGETKWMNPYGYLNGDELGFLPFYMVMAIVYLVTTVAWGFLLYRFRDGLLGLQHCLTALIAFGIVEQLLMWFDFYRYNDEGTVSVPLTVIAVAATTLKQTFARLLLLAVCMGYGVVKKKLHWGASLSLAIYGVLFYLFAEVSESADALQDKTSLPISPVVTVFTLMPVFLLDAVYYMWVFTALFRMISLLGQSGQPAKLSLYRKLALVLIAAFFFSLSMITLEFVVLGFFADGLWKIWWVWDSYWMFLNYVILLAIALIWRPNPNNGRYAYEELVSNVPGEEGETGDDVNMEMEDMQAHHRDTSLGIEEDEFSRQTSDDLSDSSSPNSGNPYKSKEESYGA